MKVIRKDPRHTIPPIMESYLHSKVIVIVEELEPTEYIETHPEFRYIGIIKDASPAVNLLIGRQNSNDMWISATSTNLINTLIDEYVRFGSIIKGTFILESLSECNDFINKYNIINKVIIDLMRSKFQ